MTIYDTIIIGAGIAGLAAGEYLSNHQHKFIVLESHHKIGGRVQTIQFANKTFSSGPGWVHGKEGNPIFDILSGLGVSMEKADMMAPGAVYVWDSIEGQNVSDTYVEKRIALNDLLDNIIEKTEAEEIFPEKNFEELLKENSKFFSKMSDFDKTVLFSTLEIYMGAPIRDISGMTEIQNDEIYEMDEEIVNYRIQDPFGVPKLIDFLSTKFKDDIHLNCKVESIDWQHESGHVIVMSENGERFIGKNVIISVQSDLLSKGHISFHPKLPDEKLFALKHVPAVNYCRIFAKFPKKFWPDNDWFLPVLKDVNPFNELLLWQNCSKQNLCSEDDNILVCHYTSGYKMENCRFDVDKEQLTELVTEAMKNIFPHDFCKPSDVMFLSHWNNCRFGGSFSVSAPGMDKLSIEQLRKNVGPLYFAGESTMVELLGTMQAAYLSGRKAAQEILH